MANLNGPNGEPPRPSMAIRQLLAGRVGQTTISYPGTGQYGANGTGSAACGLAAMNFTRSVFEKDQERQALGNPLVLLMSLVSEKVIQVIRSASCSPLS